MLRGESRQPVNGAEVRLLTGDGPFFSGARVMTTGEDGRFVFTNVGPGTYRIYVVATGYASQEYKQNSPGAGGAPLSVAVGQTLKDVTISLSPTGAIVGRVSEDSGEPAVGIPVQLFRTLFLPTGKSYQGVASTTADDRGHYRLFGLVPGQYYLAVGRQVDPRRLQVEKGQIGNDIRGYAFRLYPGVSNVNQAVLIEVRPGTELTMDMKAVRRQTYVVRGTVIDPETGLPRGRINLSLVDRSLTGGGATVPIPDYYSSTGAFEVSVPPGDYILVASMHVLDDAARAAGEAAWAVFPTARVPITVVDEDLQDIALTLKRPSALTGVVRVDGQASAGQVRIALEPFEDVAGRATTIGNAGNDGRFQVLGVLPGNYSVMVQYFPRNLYVRSIRYEGMDILNQPLQFSGSVNGEIEIVLDPDVAQLSGTVLNAQSRPVSGSTAMLLPDQRSRKDLYRSIVSDQNGRFILSDLAPGDYKIFAWEALELSFTFDPDFIRQFEQQGKRVHIEKSRNDSVDVQVIGTAFR